MDLAATLAIVLTGINAAVVFRAMLVPQRFYEYPTLAALVFLGWCLPQVRRIVYQPDMPTNFVVLTLLVILMSYIAILVGGRRRSQWTQRKRSSDFIISRLLIGSICLSVFGSYFAFKLRGLPPELLEESAWTGLPVAYLFLARTQMLAFTICSIIYFRNRNKLALCIGLYNMAFFVDAIVVGGRREVIAQTFLTVLLSAWFGRRWVPPRMVFVAGVVLGSIFVNNIGEYRTAAGQMKTEEGQHSWSAFVQDLSQADFFSPFSVSDEGPVTEIQNAAMRIGATYEEADYKFGVVYWNALIFFYVPAQLFGPSFKADLMLPDGIEDLLSRYNFESPPGLTPTGFSDSFRAFGFFGCVVFFGIARLLTWLLDEAETGRLDFQFYYTALSAASMITITHGTARLLADIPYILAFSLPVFWFARSGKALTRSDRRDPGAADASIGRGKTGRSAASGSLTGRGVG